MTVKRYCFLAILMIVCIATPVIAGSRWNLDIDEDGQATMKPQYDYDYSKRYRGEVEDDGYTRLRNPSSGDTLRGYIDEDGYGSLRDSDGNRIRIRPR